MRVEMRLVVRVELADDTDKVELDRGRVEQAAYDAVKTALDKAEENGFSTDDSLSLFVDHVGVSRIM
jgi:hypothetical protein